MQLTINFEAGLAESYSSCRELIASRIHQQGRPQKAIAADMDYSPSDLSRKCAQNPDDSRRLTLDDFEKFIDVTNDKTGIYYLIEKYLAEDSIDELERKIQQLKEKRQQAA